MLMDKEVKRHQEDFSMKNEAHDIVRYGLLVSSARHQSYHAYAKYVLYAELFKANEAGTVHTTMPIVTDSKSLLKLKMQLYGLKFEKGAKPNVVRQPHAVGEQLSHIAYVDFSVVPL